MSKKLLILCGITASAIVAASGSGSGGGSGTGGVTAPNTAEVRTLNARVPAASTFQSQFLLTQPRPIGSGGSSISIASFDINGVAIFSPLGDACGAAVWDSGLLNVNVISPSGDYGTNLDYPYMTVTMTVPSTVATGSVFPLSLVSANYIGPTGPLTLTDPKPGTLTVGGSISIHNVVPGGGTWPAGTVIKVEGTGFSPLTKLTAKMRMSPITYVSPTELRFTLLDTTTMDMLALTVQNPDGSQVTYFSYLRGIPVSSPSRPLLLQTDPVFQSQTHGTATFSSLPPLALGQFAAIAVQNPTPGPVVVSFQVQSTGATTTVTLPSGRRIMDEISALIGTTLDPSDSLIVNATAGVQILGLLGDDNAKTVMPFLPAF